MVLVALAAVSLFGGSSGMIVAVLGLLLWDRFAVVMRSVTMQISRLDFVAAARVIGCSTPYILVREILPNCLAQMVVVATVEMAMAILMEAALSFLGLGVQPPEPSLGLMLAQARSDMFFDAWMITIPGVVLFVLVLAINLIGDGIRDLMVLDRTTDHAPGGEGTEIHFPALGGLHPVRHVSFALAAGETLGIVGESGCGKSLTALALMGLLPAWRRSRGGHTGIPGSAPASGSATGPCADLRGRRIGMIFQEPMTSLDPGYTIGDQLGETYTEAYACGRRAARERVGGGPGTGGPVRRPASDWAYPHQLSGGCVSG